MTEPGRAPSLVVLQRVQPLTTDLAVLGIPGVVVLTDGPEHAVTRADAPPPPRVVRLPRSEWLPRLRSWAAEGPLDVLANDELAMARVVSGHDLETAHLTVQLGRPAPEFAATGTQAAWISVLARPDERYLGPPQLGSGLRVHRFPAPGAATGRFIALMALLTNADHGQLVGDVEQCVAHPWFG
jgi:hypothetical protein